MPKTEHVAEPVIVDYTCDKCGQGQMRPTGQCLTSNPPQYPHICTNCDHRQTFSATTYPYTTFRKKQ